MKNSILNLGKVLNKKEQKGVNGGLYWCAGGNSHTTNRWCPVCCFMGNCLL
ncbi:hypothetical protein [Tenacibaculum aiptasiae]|uniref:hypothetical protein n=1 Tax=Tenacibaculum aiptasiae TaxID=426481 RepID=UPI0023302240|nr:hypothetical protein [Tenacibaculum aiptasiae]